MRIWWVIKSAAVGLIVMLLICYMFSIAFSISARENKMINKLDQYKDNTFDYSLGSGDLVLLAALGSLITMFAGGITAAVISRLEKGSDFKWLATPAIVAIFTILAIDAYIYMAWDHGMQAYDQIERSGYGGPVEATPFIVPLLIMLVIDGACFVAAASGGAVAWISKDARRS